MNEGEHSWREIDLGGVTLTVALAGNLFNTNSSSRDWLVRLIAVLDEWPVDGAEVTA